MKKFLKHWLWIPVIAVMASLFVPLFSKSSFPPKTIETNLNAGQWLRTQIGLDAESARSTVEDYKMKGTQLDWTEAVDENQKFIAFESSWFRVPPEEEKQYFHFWQRRKAYKLKVTANKLILISEDRDGKQTAREQLILTRIQSNPGGK